jgi:GntR family transcriptional regulator
MSSESKIVALETPGLSRYAALAAALRNRVVSGEWPPGSALTAEHILATEHHVALGTMRRALELLVNEGLIERVHGKGTFVRQGIAGASMLRFFRFVSGNGEVPRSHILSRQRVAAPGAVARQLGLATGEQVLRLHRVRMLAEQPCLLEELWLPLDVFAPLMEGSTADWDDLLYPMFARCCGIHVHRAVDNIGFAALTAPQAGHLKLAGGHPGVVVRRAAYDLGGRCVEWRITRGDAHAFDYTVTIT